MAGSLFYNPKPHFETSAGLLASGYKLFFYVPSTTTKKDTYTTSGLSVANSNPIVLNSRGESTNDIYLNGAYKVVLATSTASDPPSGGDIIWTVDNVTSLNQLTTTSTKTSNYTVTTSDNGKVFFVDCTSGSITISLPAVSSAGDGFTVSIKKIDSSANTVTIDGNSSETIDGSLTYVLTKQNEGTGFIVDGVATAWRVVPAVKNLKDSNNNLVIETTATASAVNYINATNAATGNNPSLAAAGTDSNINLSLTGKGTGNVVIGSNKLQLGTSGPTIGPSSGGIDFEGTTTGTFNFKATSSQEAKIKLFEDTDNGSNSVTITPPASLTADRTVTLPDADITLQMATQAEMETATATNRMVAPGTAQYHPGMAKAWVYFTNSGTPTINVSHNVTSLTDSGLGIIGVNFTTAFSGNYTPAGMAIRAGTGAASVNVCEFVTIATNTLTMTTFSVATGSGANGEVDCTAAVVCFGDQ
jgi:hypothetical protein